MRSPDSVSRRIFSNFWPAALLVSLIAVTAQAADKPVGDAAFNASDRLAVVNLVSSYGPLYDQFKMTEWRALFVEKPVLEFWLNGKKQLEGIDLLLAITQKRQEYFKQEKLQRRHFLTPRFVRQTADTITGEAYFQLLTNKGDKPAFVTTGLYEFTAVNEGNQWKFSRWVAHLDNPLD